MSSKECAKCNQTRYRVYSVSASAWYMNPLGAVVITYYLCGRCLMKHIRSGKTIEDFLSAEEESDVCEADKKANQ